MPRFSIVVPTRNRAYTLIHTLRTCLNQKDFDDYEVVVSNNCSTDNTEEVVKGLDSDKIKYFKTNEPLAMTDHWNFAIEKASGEYIMFVGSDDAVLPYGLYFLDKVIETTDAKTIYWVPPSYWWADHRLPYRKNYMILHYCDILEIIPAKENIKEVLNYKKPLGHIPYIYAVGATHRTLIDKLVEKSGAVFDSTGPDTYFGFALSALIDSYISVSVPVCMVGKSGSSCGSSSVYGSKSSPEVEDVLSLNKQYGRVSDGKFCSGGVSSMNDSIVYDDFINAKKNFNAFGDIQIDITKHIRAVIKECYEKYMYLGDEGKRDFLNELTLIRKIIEKDDELRAAFDGKGLDIEDYIFYESEFAAVPAISGKLLLVDANQFGVENIYDATFLAEKLLYNKKSIDVHLRKLEDYWNGHKKLFNKLDACKRVGFFATGKHTEALLNNYQCLSKSDTEIFVFDNDSSKWGAEFMGRKVLPPQSMPELKPDVLIVSSYIYQNEIYESIKQYSKDKEIIKLYGNEDAYFKFSIID